MAVGLGGGTSRVGQSLPLEKSEPLPPPPRQKGEKKAKERFALPALPRSPRKERRSDSPLYALSKRVKAQFALCRSFGKEQKNKLLLVALFEKSERAIERLPNPAKMACDRPGTVLRWHVTCLVKC